MTDLNLSATKVTAPPGCPRGNSKGGREDFNYDEGDLNHLRSWVALTATQGVVSGEDRNKDKAGEEGEGAVEMEALRAFAESVGHKGNIMDGVVTQCAGGAIEKIRWSGKELDGTLSVGDLNMPKLRVLNLGNNKELKGDIVKLNLPESMTILNLSGSAVTAHADCPRVNGDLCYENAAAVDILRQWQATQ